MQTIKIHTMLEHIPNLGHKGRKLDLMKLILEYEISQAIWSLNLIKHLAQMASPSPFTALFGTPSKLI
jgi:hypothetical protein